MFDEERIGKAIDYLGPRTTRVIQDFIHATDNLNLNEEEKAIIQSLAVETLLYNTTMENKILLNLLVALGDHIIKGHSYSGALDWKARNELFKEMRKLKKSKKRLN